MSNEEEVVQHPVYPLIYDPQTSGLGHPSVGLDGWTIELSWREWIELSAGALLVVFFRSGGVLFVLTAMRIGQVGYLLLFLRVRSCKRLRHSAKPVRSVRQSQETRARLIASLNPD